MKKLILALCAVCSFSVSAESKLNTWVVNPNGLAGVMGQNADDAVVYEYESVGPVLVRLSGLRCDTSETGMSLMDVNGVTVRFKYLCVLSYERLYAESEKGRKFLYEQFKSKKTVKIGDEVFSAIGFMDAVNKAKMMEKEAL